MGCLSLSLGLLLLSAPAMAQEDHRPQPQGNMQEHPQRPPKMKHLTVDSVNRYMAEHLQLTAKQEKQVRKLNAQYAEVIEGKHPDGRGPAAGGNRQPPQGGRGQDGHGGMGGPGMGGPGDMGGPGMRGPGGESSSSGSQSDPFEELEKKQAKYEKKLAKILTEQQYAGYEKIKPSFASQRMNSDFLLHGQQPVSQ